MSSTQVLGQSAMDTGLSAFSEFFQAVWFEFAVFVGTFLVALVIKLKSPKEISKKQKGFQEATPKECFRPRHPESAGTANDKRRSLVTPEGRNGTQSQKSSSRNFSELSQDPVRLVFEVCDSLRGSQRSLQTALDRYEDMKLAGSLNQLVSLESQLRQRFKLSLQDFYNALVQCASRVGKPDLVQKFVEDMRNIGVPRDRNFFESAMKILAGKKCYHQALQIYSQMEQDGVEPSPVTCSCLVNFATEVGELDRAISFFEKLSTMERPSIRAYMTILRVFSKMQNWQRSLQTLADMQSRGLEADTLVYNIVLATCVQSEKIDQAEALLKENLCKKPPAVDVVSFNTVIKGLAQKGEFHRAIAFLEEMTQQGVKPNIITFNTVMDSAVRCNKPAEAWHVLSLMKKAGFYPDRYSCSILVKGLHSGGGATQDQIQNCLGLIKGMTGGENRQLMEGLFQSLLDAAIGMGNLNLVKEILASLRAENVVPSAGVYNALFKFLAGASEFSLCFQLWDDLLLSNCTAHVIVSTFGMLVEIFVTNGHVAQAFQLFQKAQGQWRARDSGTSALSAFIQALCKARQPTLAIQAYDTAMTAATLTNKELDRTTYGLLVKAKCEAGGLAAAVTLVEDARKLGIEPDDTMVSPLLTACFREAQVKLGQKLFEDYLTGGGHPNQVMLCTMVKLYGRCQKLQLALDLVELMKSRYNLEPSGPTYTALLQAYVKNKQPGQALKIFQEKCKTSAITPDAAMYSTLISACTQANMVGQGVQLAEEALEKNIEVSSDVLQNLIFSAVRRRPPTAVIKQLHDLVEKYKVPIEDKIWERLSQPE